MGSLPLYERFWEGTSGEDKYKKMDGGKGQPLGAQHPTVQNQMLEYLSDVADSASTDGWDGGWMDLIDPALSYQENKQRLLSEPGTESPFKRDRKQKIADLEVQQEQHKKESGDEPPYDPRNEVVFVVESPFDDSVSRKPYPLTIPPATNQGRSHLLQALSMMSSLAMSMGIIASPYPLPS